jgi:hypothetical protein
MGGYGGNLTRKGQTNSLFDKNIDAMYRAPKDARLFGIELNASEPLSIAQLLAKIPDNYIQDQIDNSSTKWIDNYQKFSGKDGQTNAYVKRGMDFELVEVADGYETTVVVWHFSTDDVSIDFNVGGKIYTAGREWTIMKIINQFSRGTATNKYFAMNTMDNDLVQKSGYMTFVLV